MENENKFDMFASLVDRDFDQIENEEVELVSVTAKAEGSSSKKLRTVAVRSQEDYETFIESVRYDTLIHPSSGEEYQVKVTVLKPEVNPLENMRPCFAYSSTH